MKIIPAIDLLDGEVVRLLKGNYEEKKIYSDDPFAQAERFSRAGFEHIHIVDLNGAKSGEFLHLHQIVDIITRLNLSVQTGGGIRSFNDVEKLLEAGVSRVICSSLAVHQPDEWLRALQTYPGRCILGLDLKEGKISYGGWLETDERTPEEFLAPMLDAGLREILSTDISKDGTLEGPNLELYRDLGSRFPGVRWIASGGVSSLEDLKELKKTGVAGVVVGKAYYEGRITLEELSQA